MRYFRFFSEGLTEPRLQYAVAKESSVIPVWLWALCECCKKQSDTFAKLDHPTLIGVAHSLNQTPESVQRALLMLCEIRYIEETEDGYKVLKWCDLQSEYMQRKTSKVRDHFGSFPSISEKNGKERKRTETDGKRRKLSKGEERRGEEKREEKKNTASAVACDFEAFWETYPRRVGKLAAQRAWAKANLPAFEVIVKAIDDQSRGEQWRKDGGAFIPHPATWINEGRWLDQPAPASTPKKGGAVYDD